MARPAARTRSALAAAVLLAGCMSYIPTDPSELPVGSKVRVQISRRAFAELPQISDRQGQSLEGSLVSRDDAGLTIHVPLAIGSNLGQDLTIPMEGVVGSELREVSKGRTLLAAAAGVAVVVGLVIGPVGSGAEGATLPGGPKEPPPGDQDGFRGLGPFARILSFSIPIP